MFNHATCEDNLTNFMYCATCQNMQMCPICPVADVLHELQSGFGDAQKVGFENTKDFFAVLAPLASFCNLAKGWRQHQLLLGALRFLPLTIC